jgi:hypothetical protein
MFIVRTQFNEKVEVMGEVRDTVLWGGRMLSPSFFWWEQCGTKDIRMVRSGGLRQGMWDFDYPINEELYTLEKL